MYRQLFLNVTTRALLYSTILRKGFGYVCRFPSIARTQLFLLLKKIVLTLHSVICIDTMLSQAPRCHWHLWVRLKGVIDTAESDTVLYDTTESEQFFVMTSIVLYPLCRNKLTIRILEINNFGNNKAIFQLNQPVWAPDWRINVFSLE